MKTIFSFALLVCCFFLSDANSSTPVWSGQVQSDGSVTPNIKIVPGQMYQIKVSGTVTLGNWSKNGQPLVNDAGYEFNAVGKPTTFPILKNSLGIPLGDGKFHADHVYESSIFNATKDTINFWIFDTDYSDNKGALQVELSLINPNDAGATAIWKGSLNSGGAPSPSIPLTIGKNYQIIVSGQVSLGRWSKNGKEMINDACYEFNAVGAPVLLQSFNNSLGISVCDGKFHPNHIYQSLPFAAEKESISFWVFDTDYSDNNGAFQVQLNQIN